MLRVVGLAGALALVLIGCQTTKSVWMRADGRQASAAEFELDQKICEGAVAQTDIQGAPQFCRGIAGCAVTGMVRGMELNKVREGCMASKGYVLRQVPVDGAAQTAEAATMDKNATAASEPAVQQAAVPPPTPQPKRPTKQAAAKQKTPPPVGGPYVPPPAPVSAPEPPEPTMSEADRMMNMRN